MAALRVQLFADRLPRRERLGAVVWSYIEQVQCRLCRASRRADICLLMRAYYTQDA